MHFHEFWSYALVYRIIVPLPDYYVLESFPTSKFSNKEFKQQYLPELEALKGKTHYDYKRNVMYQINQNKVT